LLAVLGNTEQGLSWATSALINPDLRSLLAGNFAAINDQQIITTDTRLSPVIDSNPTPVAEVAILPAANADTTSQPKNQQNTWVFPVFILSIILILLISVFAAIGSWLRHRTRGNTQAGYRRPAIANFLTSIKEWFKKMRNRRKDGGS